VFTIDLIDFDTVSQNEPVLDRFLEESGHSDPALLRPPAEIVESDDNHDLDLDACSVEGDANSLCSPLCLSSLVAEPHLMDMELLNACVDTIDPASHALYNMHPLEGTQEHCALESAAGYSYHQVLGEIIYVYVVCHLDIGYAAMLLSRFSQAPAREQYKALKDIVKYLRHTVDWGIIYWRQNLVDSLPRINLPDTPIDPSLPTFPTHDLL
jgi:hypothetical protein